MNSSNEGFDLDLMHNMVRDSIKSHIASSGKDVLENYILSIYDQDSRLYAKVNEWMGKIPKDYVESLGIDHNWESNDIFEWFNMFIQLVETASELNYIVSV
jgi:hypothetical protein